MSNVDYLPVPGGAANTRSPPASATARGMNEVEIGAARGTLLRAGQALVEVPQKGIRITRICTMRSSTVAGREKPGSCVAPLNLVYPPVTAGRTRSTRTTKCRRTLQSSNSAIPASPALVHGMLQPHARSAQSSAVLRPPWEADGTARADAALGAVICSGWPPRLPGIVRGLCPAPSFNRRVSRRLRVHSVAHAFIALLRPEPLRRGGAAAALERQEWLEPYTRWY
jgi:hypothetical protein